MTEDVPPDRARFDRGLQAWVLSRHEDVSAALREPRLAPDDPSAPAATHIAVRHAAAHTLAADRLQTWRTAFEHSALERAAALPTDCAVDLLASFAAPWALSLAVTVTGASPADATHLASLAREIFLAAAFRTGARLRPESHAPAAELARLLPAAEAGINVQTFVALSQTLPHLLGGCWLELFGPSGAARRGRNEPRLPPQEREELLRRAGPARAVFRYALADLTIGDACMRSGDRVILMLAAANRDSARYADPDRADFHRGGRDHLAFGGGAHACAGARLTRAAVAIATEALLRTTDAVELTGPVKWIDGFAIRAPASLPAVLRRHPRPAPGHAAHVSACG